jgi:class 3 adenylate cyclase
MPRREWSWRLDLPAATLWPVLADTDRFNEALTLPPYRLRETPRADGTVERRGTAKVAGFELAWEEKPYEWVLGRSYRQTRVFTKGPFRRFGPELVLQPDGEGTRVSYALTWEPLGAVGHLLGARLASQSGAAVEKRVLQAAEFLRGARPTVYEFPPPRLPDGAAARLAAATARLSDSPYAHGLGQRLADHLATAPASALMRLRPKALARELGVAPRQAVELCLAAAHAGMLAMRWDLLCPSCRGAKRSVATLDALPTGTHCPSCDVDFERDFDRNVELTFAPLPSIRTLAEGGFCLSGPGTTPHVLVQQLLAPGEQRRVSATLPPGPYRLRTLHPGRAIEIDHDGGVFPGLRAGAGGVDALPPAEDGSIAMRNDTGHELALLIEDRRWVADALTAHEVTTLQAFRDLFAAATLRPGDEASIGRVALLFTDLQGSTALYERVGDAVAFNMVREHFAFLAATVRDHGGAVVKTIGDAVMAVFNDPADAVMAALSIQRRAGELNARLPDGAALVVKIGVHEGACIAVTLNDRLDYFGSTVNMAARLQGQSHGGDVVLSIQIAGDPAVQPLLSGLTALPESVGLKGFAEPVPYLRIEPVG